MLKSVLLATTLLSLSMAAQLHAASPEAREVFLLTGQSNMSGRGLLTDLTEADKTPDAAIQLYGNDEKWRVAAEPLDGAAGQVDAVSTDNQAAVGPGLFFARAISKLRKSPVVLVPCAKGGVSIGRWKPAQGRDSLYGSCIARAGAVGAEVTGILYYQGESDAEKTGDAAERWGADFKALVAAFRKDLGAPRLPVVFVQLADPPPQKEGDRPYPSWTAIQDVQAGPFGECVAMISAKGLPLKDDGLHLSTAGQRALGDKLAAAMNGLLQRGCQ